MIRALLAVCGVAASLAASQPLPATRVTTARISPDGQWIAFARQSGAGGAPLGLFKITIGGQDEQRVAPPDGVISDITWSPKSDAIVYASRSSAGEPGRLRSVPAAGGSPRSIAPAEAPVSPPRSLTPKDSMVDVRDATVLFVTPVAGDRQALTLSNGKETWIDLASKAGDRVTVMPPGVARIVAPPSWSADGKRFAVVAAPGGDGAGEIFGGFLPLPQPNRPDWVGAAPPMVRQLTGIAR